MSSSSSSSSDSKAPSPSNNSQSPGLARSISTKAGALFNRLGNDSSVSSARQKVIDAEVAERQADQALEQARQRVKAARDQVKVLEHEAHEAARRAAAKQEEMQRVIKSAKNLGRHG
ncbi:hypothetical protein BDN72DRAFT_766127 [Pluteus cervinus]|uniref:Uncharacterized protein n=1 Tax=Pluteus cervinus TaxID=181527 RepID=A0ACD3AXB1_9AGAR|nr:hypothetical protein BDN72DRAFT_766127 [Pluteus cervinus]